MPQTIAYYSDSIAYGGTEQVLVSLLTHLDRTRWHPILIHHPEPGIEPLLEQARNLEVKTRVIPRMQGPRAVQNFPRLIRVLQEEKPVIFHPQLNWLLSCKFGLLAAALLRVPATVATLHQFLSPPWKKNIYWQQQLVAAAVKQYITVSSAVAQQLSASFHVPPHKIKVVHNGISFSSYDRFADRTDIVHGDEPLVLTVARLDDQKGHQFLLEAVGRIPNAIFAFAGDGPKRAALEAQARALGIANRVLFLGHRADVPDLLAGCDLFVLPSLYEGLPLSILEAMAAGKAVVATAVGGTPELVEDSRTGLLVPAGDPIALADAIQKILSNPILAVEMGILGRSRVRREFSIERMSQSVFQIYDDLLAGNQKIDLIDWKNVA